MIEQDIINQDISVPMINLFDYSLTSNWLPVLVETNQYAKRDIKRKNLQEHFIYYKWINVIKAEILIFVSVII